MKKIIFWISIALLTGCENPLGGRNSIVDQNHRPGVSEITQISSGNINEFVSSSSQDVYSVSRRYKIQGSLGSPSDKVFSVLPSGKKIYMNVQGDLISPQVTE